jgi:hypothetical protein
VDGSELAVLMPGWIPPALLRAPGLAR